jgi:hypothetical protein
MAASFSVGASGNTITVTITTVSGSGYNAGNASVQVTNNSTGGTVPSNADNTVNTPGGATRTVTYIVASGAYAVQITCGGETSGSSVTTGNGTANIP